VIRFISVGAIPMILIVVVGAGLYGCLQGYIIARLQIPSIVFTLGTMILVGGVEYEVSNQQVVYLAVNQLNVSDAVRTQILIFSPASLAFIAVTILVGLLLGFTRIGREIYALGGAREESRIAGISQVRPVVVAFTISASLAALAGALASLREGGAGPQAYDSLLLTAVTGALIGGISLYGGRGRIAGVFVGVLILQFLVSALGLESAPFWAAGFAEGTLLLVFLIVELAQTSSPLRRGLERRLLAHRQRQEAEGANSDYDAVAP
jgi:ribose transport system permease protein